MNTAASVAAIPVIRLKSDRAPGHPWVWSAQVYKPEAKLPPGSVVEVQDAKGRFVARAFWNGHARIALRLLGHDENDSIDAAWIAARIARAVQLRRDWQSVEEVVGAAIRSAQPALSERTVQTALAPDLPLVEFDAVLIERVLVNLLENAAKYGAPPIVVGAHATVDALVLSVRDHGPGLPAALRGREQLLFDKFTRGQTESATPGVGLGLAICKAIVGAHGGEITAANASGGGAEFTVTLPRRPPPASAEADDQPS